MAKEYMVVRQNRELQIIGDKSELDCFLENGGLNTGDEIFSIKKEFEVKSELKLVK